MEFYIKATFDCPENCLYGTEVQCSYCYGNGFITEYVQPHELPKELKEQLENFLVGYESNLKYFKSLKFENHNE